MALARGTTLGPYQIESPLGAGGMGEVYKATDTRLERTVAIKVLPAHVASDPERKSRFEREAKTVAALSHPHICPVFDVGSEDGTDFLVMEYLEGETLAARLAKGALPLDQALKYAAEIADALDKAHRQGVTHRDLKPANIMLTKTGAKLLDFGLAKLTGADRGEASTRTAELLTRPGAILGTLPYMAPEQVQGKSTDARTDLFAFGAIVHEMLTGRRVFKGDNQASLIAAILDAQPPSLSTLLPVSPPALDQLVTRCLSKDADDRWQTARDLHAQLAWIRGNDSQSGEAIPTIPAARPRYRQPLPLALAAVAAGTLVTVALVWALRADPSGPPARLVVSTPPEGPVCADCSGRTVAISPDGRVVVYQFFEDNDYDTRGLWLRPLDRFDAAELRGTQGASAFSFSPNGGWLAFADVRDDTRAMLRKVPVDGGTSVTVATLDRPPQSIDWGPGDVIVYSNRSHTRGAGLSWVPGAGGEPIVLTTPDPNEAETDHWWPHMLPDGKTILFTAWAGSDAASRIAALSVETGDVSYVDLQGTHPQFTSTGHLVYGVSGTLWAAGFDPSTLEVTSTPVPVVENLLVTRQGTANFGLADDGSLVYLSDQGGGRIVRSLVWVDREGQEEDLGLAPRQYDHPRVSPDGRRVAVSIGGEESLDLWVWDVARGGLSRITTDPANDGPDALWTPDSERVVFQSDRNGTLGLFWRAVDGTGDVEHLVTIDDVNIIGPTSFSPGGDRLLFHALSPGGGWDIGMLTMVGERRPTLLVQTDATEYGGAISPDGAWVAFTSSEAGSQDVYVARFPEFSERHRVSTEGGRSPVWSADGREIVFRRFGGGGQLMTVAVSTSPTFTVGTPAVIFEEPYFRSGGRNWDLAPDGRLLMIREHLSAPDIHVALRWTAELTRLAPID